MPRSPISFKAQQFTGSVIREMTRLALLHGATNLAQGYPDFPAPSEVKEAAVRAIRSDVNQYPITWGAREFRRAVAERFERDTHLVVDPEREVTVCCGATETMIATLLAILNPGDEIIVFEPFYENYGPDAIICRRANALRALDAARLDLRPAGSCRGLQRENSRAGSEYANNPTGKVFTQAELNASPSNASGGTRMP